MDYHDRQFWKRQQEAEALRRERERERAMQFPPGALEEAEGEFKREGMRQYFEEKRKREAQGCHCRFASDDPDGPSWRYQRLAEPRSDCPLHAHLVPEFKEKRKRAEQAREAAREHERQATARANARIAIKEAIKKAFLWLVAGIVLFVVAFIIGIIFLIVITPGDEAPTFLFGLTVIGVVWVLLLWFFRWIFS